MLSRWAEAVADSAFAATREARLGLPEAASERGRGKDAHTGALLESADCCCPHSKLTKGKSHIESEGERGKCSHTNANSSGGGGGGGQNGRGKQKWPLQPQLVAGGAKTARKVMLR